MEDYKVLKKYVSLVTMIIGPKYFLLFLFSFGFTSSMLSQSEMRFIGKNNKQKIHFETNNNLIIIPITVNGKNLSFILDSGASKTIIFNVASNDSIILNKSKKIKLRGLGSGEPIEGIRSEDNIIKIKNIMGIHQTIYVVFDNKFDLSLKMGKTIHGIIGYDLLKNFVTKIDYRKKQLIFYNSKDFSPPNSKKYKNFSLHFHHKKPYLDALVNLSDTSRHSTKLLIDSGNSDALWLFENIEAGITTQNNFFIDHMGDGLSGSIDGKRSKIKSFRIGSFIFNNPTVAFLDSTATSYARSYEDRDGSIGSRILNRFTVYLDYPHQRIYLKKTKSFDKEFKYNRAGIELMYAGKTLVKENNIVNKTILGNQQFEERTSIRFEIDYKYSFKPIYAIYKIRPGSPAEQIGLQVNDIISEINGKPAYEYKLQEIRNLFYDDVGTPIKFKINRKNTVLFYQVRLVKPL